jgi:HK97 family phage prohead protease
MKPTEPLVEAGAREERAATLANIEVRKSDNSDALNFQGRAAVFDEWTEINDPFGSFSERVQRGAFRKVLSDGADVRFLGLNHDPNTVMARTAAGTMKLKESAKGLEVDAELAPTQGARDLAALLNRGDVSQMSFGFRVGKDIWEYDEVNDTAKRTIVEFSDLFDVSPVTFPAYQGTTAAMRACGVELVSARGEIDEERLLSLSLKIFRGDQSATESERAAIDGVFARTSIVSPWMAERAARAYVEAPDLRAVLLDSGITMDVAGTPPVVEPSVGGGRSAVAARRWLEVLAA